MEGEGSWGLWEKALRNAYKIGAKITMSRESEMIGRQEK